MGALRELLARLQGAGTDGHQRQVDEATGNRHPVPPERPDLTFDPDTTRPPASSNWVRPLMPANRAQSTHIHRVPRANGMTDTDFPSISLINLRHSPGRLPNADGAGAFAPALALQHPWVDGPRPVGRIQLDRQEPPDRHRSKLEVRERITALPGHDRQPRNRAARRRHAGRAERKASGHQDFGVYATLSPDPARSSTRR